MTFTNKEFMVKKRGIFAKDDILSAIRRARKSPKYKKWANSVLSVIDTRGQIFLVMDNDLVLEVLDYDVIDDLYNVETFNLKDTGSVTSVSPKRFI